MLRMGLGARSELGYGLGVSAPGGAAPAWWPVADKTCVIAYQAKGAASYVVSKINLANPGTYDATNGTAYPTWDAAIGWTLNGSSQYLKIATSGFRTILGGGAYTAIATFATDITPNTRQVILADWNSAGSEESLTLEISGYTQTTQHIGSAQKTGGASVYIDSTVHAVTGTLVTVGVTWAGSVAQTRTIYVDGVSKATTNSAGWYTGSVAAIGRAGDYNGIYLNGRVTAVALYAAALTATEMAIVSAAMAAL